MSPSNPAIIETRVVTFYDDELTAVRSSDGTVYVPVKPICERLGINWSSQVKRIRRDAVLSQEVLGMVITTTPGGAQEMLCLPLTFVHGWLFGLTAGRVKEELREQLIRYQRECFKVLSEAFLENKVTARSQPDIDALLETDHPSAVAYRNAMAVANLARQQLVLETRIDKVEGVINFQNTRLNLLEAKLGNPDRYIDATQASKISQAVKAIGLELGKRSGRNEFGGVYGELYRRFEIAGYRELPAARYDEAFNFLSDWFSSITNTDLPF